MAGLGQQIQLFPRSGCSGSGFGPGKQHSSLFFCLFFSPVIARRAASGPGELVYGCS